MPRGRISCSLELIRSGARKVGNLITINCGIGRKIYSLADSHDSILIKIHTYI